MPQGFENCVKKGGKVKTKKLKNNKYIRICYLNGKSYAGEVKEKKSEKSSKKSGKKEMLSRIKKAVKE